MDKILSKGKSVVKADLHIHTYYSDGDNSPAEVAQRAYAAGVKFASVTDHDTCDGVEEFAAAAQRLGIETISGIEFSCLASFGEVHILGYGFQLHHKGFNARLQDLKRQRRERVRLTLERLQGIGYKLTAQEVPCGESGICGRAHIAKAMVKKGYCDDVSQAFDRFLGFGKAAYVDSYKMPVKDALTLITAAGGISVLAHPCQMGLQEQMAAELIKSYAQMGLGGIEADYYAHTKAQQRFYTALARQLNLICTGGSDFHGDIRPSPVRAFDLEERDYAELLKCRL